MYFYNEFKGNYFRGCLKYGYNSSTAKDLLSGDASFASDFPLGTQGYHVVDSLARVQMDLIKQDSTYYFDEIKLGDPLYGGMKRVLQLCLEGYESQTVDSMAIVWAKRLSPE